MPTPERVEFRDPHIRSIASWSPKGARSALNLLMNGQFSLAAQLADAILADDRVQATIDTRVNGVLSLPMDFAPVAEESDRARVVADDLESDFWTMFPEDALNELQTYGLMLGACPAELVWETGGGKWLPRLKVWHPSLLTWVHEERTWRIRTEQGGEMPFTPGDGKWLLYTPYGPKRPWTKARVRSLAIPFVAKQYAVGDWQRHSEIVGGGIRKGKAPSGIKDEDRQAFLSDLKDLASDAAIVLPDGWDLELIESRAQNADAFEKLIEWADTAIAISVLGQNLTTEVEGGSLAAARVHENVKGDLIRADTEGLATTIRRQAIRHWAIFNYGDEGLAPWPKWQSDPPEDQKQLAETMRTFGEGLTSLQNAGLRLDLPELARKFGVPLAQEEEGTDDDEQIGQLFQYHFEFGVITVNEARARLGLPPIAGGDRPAERVLQDPMAASLKFDRDAGTEGSGSGRHFRLASGDRPADAPGFVRGQVFADALVDQGKERFAEVLRGQVSEVLDVIRRSRSYDEVRNGLIRLYPNMDHEELAERLEASLVLADLAGRLGEVEDGGASE